jgi:hypothetical protein
MTLPDGRRLAYGRAGDPAGLPLVATVGGVVLASVTGADG